MFNYNSNCKSLSVHNNNNFVIESKSKSNCKGCLVLLEPLDPYISIYGGSEGVNLVIVVILIIIVIII